MKVIKVELSIMTHGVVEDEVKLPIRHSRLLDPSIGEEVRYKPMAISQTFLLGYQLACCLPGLQVILCFSDSRIREVQPVHIVSEGTERQNVVTPATARN